MYITQDHQIQEFDMSHGLFSILRFLRWPFVGLKMAIFDQKVVKMATRPDFFFHIRKQHISAHLTDFEPPSSKNVDTARKGVR